MIGAISGIWHGPFAGLLVRGGPFSGHGSLADGLVSYWKLDELSGTRVDSVGANDLTDNNTVTYSVAGPQHVVADFEETNSEYLSGTTFNSLPMSAQIWWKMESGPASQALLIGNYVGSSFSGWGINQASSGAVSFWYFKDNSNYNDYTTEVATTTVGRWYHTVVTIDAAGAGKIYVDGVPTTVAWGTGSAAVSAQAGALHLGFMSGVSTFDGQLGQGGIWTRELSQTDVTSLFNAGRGKKAQQLTAADKVGLVSYWNLDDAADTRADYIGSRNLTDNNTVLSVDNTAALPHNTAASFLTANSESLSKASNTDLAFGDADFSIAFWMKTAITGGCPMFHGTYGTAYNYIFDVTPGHLLQFRIFSAGSSLGAVTTGTVDDDAWHLIIATFTASTNTITLQMDDDVADSDTLSGNPTESAGAFSIGAFSALNGSPTTIFYTGKVDEAAVWSRVLTAQECIDLYAAGAGLFYA